MPGGVAFTLDEVWKAAHAGLSPSRRGDSIHLEGLVGTASLCPTWSCSGRRGSELVGVV